MDNSIICARCGHTRAKHCKGNQTHVAMKDDRGQGLEHQRTVVCKGQHCEQPICSCVSFIERAA
jgi:hypothetical protein